MEESSAKARIAVAIEHPLLQQGGMEVLIRELIPGLARHFEIVLVSRDRTKEETGSVFAPLIAEQFYWNRDRPSRQAAKELAHALAMSGVVLAHFHGGIYEWECHKAWQSPLSHSMRAGIACLMTNHLMLPLFSGYSQHERPLWQRRCCFRRRG